MYKGKTISFIGDSITSFAGISTSGNACYYPTPFLKDPEDTYWAKLVKHYGFRLGANDGWSGSRIGWDGVPVESDMIGEGKYMACQKRLDTLGRNGEPDYIVVYAGTNDIRREPLGDFDKVDWDTVLDSENMTREKQAALPFGDFAHSTSAMLAGLKLLYPKAHILALIPMWVEIDPASENTATAEIVKERTNSFGDLYIRVLEKFGIDYVDLRKLCTFENRAECVGDDPSMLHPSRAGMQKIFEAVVEYFDALEKKSK